MFLYFVSPRKRVNTFDLYDWEYIQKYVNKFITLPMAKVFIMFSVNNWIIILRQRNIKILVENGFFFNRCQNVITCHYCGFVYFFTTSFIEHNRSCIYKEIRFLSEDFPAFTIVETNNFMFKYPVYNISNWNDSFTELRYGKQTLMNSTLEHWFVNYTAAFLLQPETQHHKRSDFNSSMAKQLYQCETLRLYSNLLCLKFNFFRDACANVDTFLRKNSTLNSPTLGSTQSSHNSILAVTLNCPMCHSNVTHILSCGHSFCELCLFKGSKISPHFCLYCHIKVPYPPIKILYY